MKKLFVMALCLGLGLASTSCKKEEEVKPQPAPAAPSNPPADNGGGENVDPTTFDPEYDGTGTWIATLGTMGQITVKFNNDGTGVVSALGNDIPSTYSINTSRTKITMNIPSLLNLTDEDLNWSANDTMSFETPSMGTLTLTRTN